MNKSGHANQRAKRTEGFTIIELLVVIVVIAILAAVTLVVYNGIRAKAETAKLKSDLSQAQTQLERIKIETGDYPGDLATAMRDGLKASEGVRFEYTGSADSYCLSATSRGVKQGYSITSQSGGVKEGVCEGHNPSNEPPPPPTVASCFKLWLNTSIGKYTINGYYANQDNDPTKPSCPREVIIPSEIDGTPINRVGVSAFQRARLTSVTLPNSLTAIDNYGFYDNLLTSVTVPDSVTSIGTIAFGSNSRLTSASIPAGASYYKAGTTYQSFPTATTITVR